MLAAVLQAFLSISHSRFASMSRKLGSPVAGTPILQAEARNGFRIEQLIVLDHDAAFDPTGNFDKRSCRRSHIFLDPLSSHISLATAAD